MHSAGTVHAAIKFNSTSILNHWEIKPVVAVKYVKGVQEVNANLNLDCKAEV